MKQSSPWPRLSRSGRAELEKLQDSALRRYVREELYPFSAYYRRVFDEAGVGPRDIRCRDDLRRLPFTTKADLLEAQLDPEHKRDFVLIPTPPAIRAHWPFSRKLALVVGGASAREFLRFAYTPNFLTFTSGRSTAPVAFAYTPHDIDILGEVGSRMLDVHGLDATGERVLNAFPFAPHLAFWQTSFAGFRTGTMIIPTGGGKVMGTDGNLRMLTQLSATVLIATPGFAYHLLRTAREEGRDLSSLRTIILGAEKVTAGLKRKMAEHLAACGAHEVTISGTFGFTEARMAFSECPCPYDQSTGYHLYPDLAVVEIIDPESGEPLGEGETGEVVFTTISGHGSCVLRYRTGDVAEGGITWEPCPGCGRTVPRLSSTLRRASERHALDLTKIKGTLVDLSTLGEVLSGQPSIEEWQVVLSKEGDETYGLDRLELRLTVREGTDPVAFEAELRREVAAATEVSPNAVHFHTMPEMLSFLGMETELKEKRFLDLRPEA